MKEEQFGKRILSLQPVRKIRRCGHAIKFNPTTTLRAVFTAPAQRSAANERAVARKHAAMEAEKARRSQWTPREREDFYERQREPTRVTTWTWLPRLFATRPPPPPPIATPASVAAVQLPRDADSCAICHAEPVDESQDATYVLLPACGHYFHTTCFERYLEFESSRDPETGTRRCPTCRVPCGDTWLRNVKREPLLF